MIIVRLGDDEFFGLAGTSHQHPVAAFQKAFSEAMRARVNEKRLHEALDELSTWWGNWMPDEAHESGGDEALEKAKEALRLYRHGYIDTEGA
jgi:predicted RNase H-like HicB family nuclease